LEAGTILLRRLFSRARPFSPRPLPEIAGNMQPKRLTRLPRCFR
jgi:hypothetical protein